MKRIYRSKTANMAEASTQKVKNEKPKVKEETNFRQRQKTNYVPVENYRTHHCLNAYKRQRPSTDHLKKGSPSAKNTNSGFKGVNDDLINISLVSDADYTNRQIVRRKSNIKGSNFEVIEASLLTVNTLQKTKILILLTMDSTSQEPKFNTYRLIIGPSEIK